MGTSAMNYQRARDAWLQAAVLVLLGVAVFTPAIHGDWLHDDPVFVGGNEAVQSGSWGRMVLLWLDSDQVDYFPL